MFLSVGGHYLIRLDLIQRVAVLIVVPLNAENRQDDRPDPDQRSIVKLNLSPPFGALFDAYFDGIDDTDIW